MAKVLLLFVILVAADDVHSSGNALLIVPSMVL
jgi:hypothetical protein